MLLRECSFLCVCVCVCVRERERAYVCVSEYWVKHKMFSSVWANLKATELSRGLIKYSGMRAMHCQGF